MSEPIVRRHGLEPLLAELSGAGPAEPGVSVTIRGDLGHINVRGRASNAAFVQPLEQALGQALPTKPNTFSDGHHQVFWLGPDEWLIVTAAAEAAELAERLHQATSGTHASVNNISGGQIALMLKGARCRELLAKGCTLDLHPRVFNPGDCAQSGLARANVLLALVDETPTFMIVVRRSFSEYLCRWLAHAGDVEGIAIEDPR
jgi:sarcosine oxidase subunit gamma